MIPSDVDMGILSVYSFLCSVAPDIRTHDVSNTGIQIWVRWGENCFKEHKKEENREKDEKN